MPDVYAQDDRRDMRESVPGLEASRLKSNGQNSHCFATFHWLTGVDHTVCEKYYGLTGIE